MPTAKKIKKLILQSFLGELSNDELELLEQWKQEDPKHQLQYEELGTKWKSGELLKDWEDIDLQQNWSAIQAKAKSENVFVIGSWWRYVAAAAALIFVTVWYFQANDFQTLINQGNQFLVHDLEDGSRVWLKPGAQLTYQAADFEDDRTMQLQGEGFFEVKKGAVPFIVRTPDGSEVEVLGTSFHVMTDSIQTEVLLLEGAVKFSFQQLNLELQPGEFAVFDGMDLKKTSFNKPNAIGWQTGRFEFSETPLDQVLEFIAPYYGIETEVSEEKRKLLLTTTINQLGLDELVAELAIVLDAQVTLDQRQLIIR